MMAHGQAKAGPAEAPRAVTLLVAALGGEGGGVLTSWVVNAAQSAGYPVQATSIPGVAQRTGATTYYIELWPEPWSTLNGRAPVLALSPVAGEVDVMASTELLEATRAVRGGFVTPDRTLLIASTHRVYTTTEKIQMGDGRVEPEQMRSAAVARARQCVLTDLAEVARRVEAPLNAVLLGMLAACGRLPIEPEAFRAGIRAEGKAAEANLRGFEAGLEAWAKQGGGSASTGVSGSLSAERAPSVESLLSEANAQFPAARDVLAHALPRLVDFQDVRYAQLYLERLKPFAAHAPQLLTAVARHLAVRMTYEDAIRVAQAKIRPGRLARIRAETGATPGEPVMVTEFLKPGLEEICDVLPVSLARVLLALGRRWPRLGEARRGMYVRTSTVGGYLKLRWMAGLRRWRRRSWRYAQEQAAIEAWLALIDEAARTDVRLAQEVAECARLIKGYGDTHKRGRDNYARIEADLVRPAIAQGAGASAAEAIARAREAALADPEGKALSQALASSLR